MQKWTFFKFIIPNTTRVMLLMEWLEAFREKKLAGVHLCAICMPDRTNKLNPIEELRKKRYRAMKAPGIQMVLYIFSLSFTLH